MTPNLDRLAYRIPTAAMAMDIGVSSLWRLIAEGEIKTVKRAGTTWILPGEIQAFFARLEEQRQVA